MKKLFFLFLLLPALCSAQVNLDSLLSVWNDPNQADTSRLNAMDDIAWEGYVFSQPDSAFYFAQQQYDYAEQKGLKRYKAQALKTQGESFRVKGNYSKAMDFQLQAMKIYEEIGNKRGIAGSLKKMLLEIQDKSMEEQRTILDKRFETWRGQLEQVDDVCMIGVRV